MTLSDLAFVLLIALAAFAIAVLIMLAIDRYLDRKDRMQTLQRFDLFLASLPPLGEPHPDTACDRKKK